MSITVLYTTGAHQEVITFTTMTEKNMWDEEVLAIKADSTAAMNKKEADGLTREVRALYENWIAPVHAFRDRFGDNRTPQDIKWAVNSAQEGLGMPVTQWENPPNAALFE